MIGGLWFDPYIGEVFTDPRFLEVDHVVALAEVHRSGGDRWTPEQREAYANDLSDSSTLMAVSAASNRSKSDRGPDVWMPIRKEYRCVYVQTWVEIKKRWNLRITESEQKAVLETIASCRAQ